MVSRVWGTVVVVLVLASVCHAQVRTTMALCFPVLQMSLSTRACGILSQVLQPPRFADAENQPPAVPGCPTAAVQEAPKACTPAGTVFVMLQYLDLSDRANDGWGAGACLEIDTKLENPDPLPSAGGVGMNLVMAWNEQAKTAPFVDIYIYYHGNSGNCPNGMLRVTISLTHYEPVRSPLCVIYSSRLQHKCFAASTRSCP